ncbi:hypothetical protein A3A66_02310 [Microgenomates group bacterium RIFCSPLOWO2_01_FULL_46_13]|nr:MAG: hypothetical protein A2783_00600 [Microgenomates group bacterium RIFCSPHIGHO2_01_FULL_45_11]OGV94807.1 MAG: hypothetical protein A3A66_02310 [Microgenomates group bacterium RIFCSPLOWO2_01_FULL_46_13]
MERVEFSALGTRWTVLIEDRRFPPAVKNQLVNLARRFEKRFSRFIPSSEIGRINESKQRVIPVSDELLNLLEFANRLTDLSEGAFTSTIGGVLEAYGYDRRYQFKLDKKRLTAYRTSRLSFFDKKLVKPKGAQLDLGGFGKGYLIDQVAKLLTGQNINYFLIDGGGDMYATTKKTGEGWQVGLQHPQQTKQVIGKLELKNQAFAGSSPKYRRVGNFHHLINPHTKQPVRQVAATFVTANSAMVADGVATALFVSPSTCWKSIETTLKITYAAVFSDLTVRSSAHFPGELFVT